VTTNLDIDRHKALAVVSPLVGLRPQVVGDLRF
jgi:hypothetical protein